jgi:hypothetical protein
VPVNPNEAPSTSQPTRFVEHPARRRAWRAAQRNLAWGVAFLFAALSVVSVAMFIGGARAMMPLLIGLLSFTVLWVLARMKIFGQRNGVFFSLAIVALLGAIVGLAEQGWTHLAKRAPVEPRVAVGDSSSSPLPAVTAPQIPSLIQALQLETPDPSLPRVRANRSLTTTIGGTTYRINQGEIFLFSDEKGGEMTLSAGEYLARVPSNAMVPLAPEPPKAATVKIDDGKSALEQKANAEITTRAQQEAARRFPALSRVGSPENKDFVDTAKELAQRHSDFLDNPEWPLELAQMLARRNGWRERGVIEDETPAVVDSPIAPGTKVLAAPSAPESVIPEPVTPGPAVDPDIPLPPREPGR